MKKCGLTTFAGDRYYTLAHPLEGPHEGLCILCVSKDDGSDLCRIPIDSKEPDYQVVQIKKWLVIKTSKKKTDYHSFQRQHADY